MSWCMKADTLTHMSKWSCWMHLLFRRKWETKFCCFGRLLGETGVGIWNPVKTPALCWDSVILLLHFLRCHFSVRPSLVTFLQLYPSHISYSPFVPCIYYLLPLFSLTDIYIFPLATIRLQISWGIFIWVIRLNYYCLEQYLAHSGFLIKIEWMNDTSGRTDIV